jgi:hypothetical protein
MNSETTINKENQMAELSGVGSKNVVKPREFGRDVTNNAVAQINKEEKLTQDADSMLTKASSEDLESHKQVQPCLIP